MEYTQKDLDRFWSKVNTTDECWLWTSTTRGGYGMFSLNGRPVSAHRFIHYVYTKKNPTTVRHTCDTPSCVNPSHLVGGSHKDNSDDKYTRDRHHGVLKAEQIMEIRQQPMTRTIVADTAQKYGITESVARNIINGTTFSYLPGARQIVRQMSRSKLSLEQINEIKKELERPWWGQVNALAEKYGVTHSEISHIKNGRVHSEK